MTDRTLSRGAWGLLSFECVLFLAGGVLEWMNDPLPSTDWGTGGIWDVIFVSVIFSFPLVGALIASRQPRNAVGWIMLGIGLVQAVTGVLDGYVRYALVTKPGSLPYADYLLAILAGSWVAIIGPIGTFLILLFPDGRLPSRRWRPLAWAAGLGIVGTYCMITVFPGTFADVGYPEIRNPLGIEALGSIRDALLSVLILVPLSIVGSAAALVQRFRRSRGQDRLQLKWLAAAASVVAAFYLVVMVATLSTDLLADEPPAWVSLIQSTTPLTFVLIPAAIGIAILRYRLYNIDRLINRTLVYAGLTGILTLAYLALITVLQGLVSPLSGDSELTVAISTLAVAALFRPLRSRVQAFIDKRFYRKKYDATRTLEAFALTMRDQVDLTSLSPALIGVVSDAMQPTHVSLWIRPPR
ncbi:MAG: hypothetical protein ACR2L3_06595 [Actinomycetota bacterium]